MKPKFVTKKGWLTRYAMHCGYSEVNEGWKQKRIACFWRDSACWQVQAYDEDGYRNYWKSFEDYEEARRDYVAQLKSRNAKRTVNKG